MGRKSLVVVWRDAVRDSEELDRTAKLVALILSTYMNGHGFAWPSQKTLAAGASLTTARAVPGAIRRLEVAGFLAIEWSRGRTSHSYTATLPTTANAVRRSEWATANAPHATANADASNRERRSHESAESRALHAAAADGAAARAPIEDECGRCGQRLPLPDDIYCADCLAELAEERASA